VEEFRANRNKEKKLIKLVRKRFKRWLIGRWVVLAAVIGIVCYIVHIILLAPNAPLSDMLLYIPLVILLPAVGTLVLYAFIISGGRDIILARSAEKVFLDSEKLRNVFTPIHKQITNADVVVICVPYDNIINMLWNNNLQRLEITAEHTQTLVLHGVSTERTISNKPFIIYDYFGSMDKLLSQLEERSSIGITGRNQ